MSGVRSQGTKLSDQLMIKLLREREGQRREILELKVLLKLELMLLR